jgi:hypothetical protein
MGQPSELEFDAILREMRAQDAWNALSTSERVRWLDWVARFGACQRRSKTDPLAPRWNPRGDTGSVFNRRRQEPSSSRSWMHSRPDPKTRREGPKFVGGVATSSISHVTKMATAESGALGSRVPLAWHRFRALTSRPTMISSDIIGP